jgi:gamma-glutamyltranspeptidase/glutathione hydrolase
VRMYDKSIVASGHSLVSDAAGTILKNGGNAFDAVVAAGFAAAVTEPMLTSLGGGGLMLAHSEDRGEKIFFDFFVDTPGKGAKESVAAPDFFPVTVDFPGSSQVFNVGLASVAVPGILKGLLHIQKRLGRMGLQDVTAPAKEFALGHAVNSRQGHFLKLLRPITTLTDKGRSLYEPDGNSIKEGDKLVNSEMADFLDQLCLEGDDSFYRGEIASKIDYEMKNGGGLLTARDLATFEVHERSPLAVSYRDHVLLTSPEPSMGGTLIGLALSLSGTGELPDYKWGSGKYLINTVALMREVERLRAAGITSPAALNSFLGNKETIAKARTNMRLFSRGTTHVSVADSRGNCASMTCSNGEGSGYFAPGTGVMLNNMMGEDDLHPGGFHSAQAGERVYSMMSPSLLLQGERVKLVLGSGGSKRIRTAITQVLKQVIEFDRSLRQAVDAPRLYLDEGCLQLEPGFTREAVESLKDCVPVNLWDRQDMYFGGVHAVIPGSEGAGDPRRGGAVVSVFHK